MKERIFWIGGMIFGAMLGNIFETSSFITILLMIIFAFIGIGIISLFDKD